MEMTNLLDNSSTKESLEYIETNVDQIEHGPKIEQDTNDANECLEKYTNMVEMQFEVEVHTVANLTQVQIHHQGSNELKANKDVTQVLFLF